MYLLLFKKFYIRNPLESDEQGRKEVSKDISGSKIKQGMEAALDQVQTGVPR